MKRCKIALGVFIATVMIITGITNVFSFNRTEHDKIMTDVLFKDFQNIEINNDNKEIKALGCAVYLCIDQFNGYGEEDLDFLKKYGVEDLPDSISEIDYSANSLTHRKLTHRGWDTMPDSPSDREKWITRRNILLNTTKKIFNFNGNTNKHNSFCAILYYTHLVGDRIAAEKYDSPAVIMELGGRTNDKQDIIDELKQHIKTLFYDQRFTFKYVGISIWLDSLNIKVKKLLKRGNNYIQDEDFPQYKDYANKTIRALCRYLPEMLKEEKFFNDVFY